MPFLTFLNYAALEKSSKGIVDQLEQKDKEIQYLREREVKNADDISVLRAQVDILMSSANTMDDSGKQNIAEYMISKGIYVKK